MTIQELYTWAKDEGKENYLIKIFDSEGNICDFGTFGVVINDKKQTICF